MVSNGCDPTEGCSSWQGCEGRKLRSGSWLEQAEQHQFAVLLAQGTVTS